MGESKRRKRLDVNYGKPVKIGNRTELEWKKELSFTDREWQRIRPHFRVVDTVEDVNESIDGVWIYYFCGRETIGFTGRFAEEFGHEENVVQSNFIMVDSEGDIDDSVDAIWRYKDREGKEKISYTGRFADEKFKDFN